MIEVLAIIIIKKKLIKKNIKKIRIKKKTKAKVI